MARWLSPFRRAVLHRRVSAAAIAFADRHTKLLGHVIAELRRLAKRRISLDAAEWPATLRVTPVSLVYADLFFVDEYPALKQGLRRINRDFPYSFELSDPSTWVETAETRAYGTGTTVAGSIDLPVDQCPRLARTYLLLAHVTASAIAVIAYTRPRTAFVEEFTTLVHAPTAPDVRLHFPRRRFLGYTHYPAHKHRAEEVRELFMAANEEITRFFHSYFHAGLSLRGPLPSIEAFTVNRTRAQLSRVMTVAVSSSTRGDLPAFGVPPYRLRKSPSRS